MTPAGIEPATFRFVAQHLNHCATAVPHTYTHTHTHTPHTRTRTYPFLPLFCLCKFLQPNISTRPPSGQTSVNPPDSWRPLEAPHRQLCRLLPRLLTECYSSETETNQINQNTDACRTTALITHLKPETRSLRRNAS